MSGLCCLWVHARGYYECWQMRLHETGNMIISRYCRCSFNTWWPQTPAGPPPGQPPWCRPPSPWCAPPRRAAVCEGHRSPPANETHNMMLLVYEGLRPPGNKPRSSRPVETHINVSWGEKTTLLRWRLTLLMSAYGFLSDILSYSALTRFNPNLI